VEIPLADISGSDSMQTAALLGISVCHASLTDVCSASTIAVLRMLIITTIMPTL